MRNALRVFAVAMLLTAGADALNAGVAVAQDAAEDRSQAFQAVEGAVKEDVPGGPLLVGAYGLIWLVVFGYLVRLVRLQGHTGAEIARLEKALADGAKPGAAGAGDVRG